MANYQSSHTGATIDDAVGKVANSGVIQADLTKLSDVTASAAQLDETKTLSSTYHPLGGSSTQDFIAQNLTVHNTFLTKDSQNVQLGDAIITLNAEETGTPTENAGIEVERGTSTNVLLRWNETADRWEFTNDGTTYYNIPISTEYATYVSSDFTHDDLTGFVANEHIDHSTITLTAGAGLSGGGDITASRSFAVDLNELTTETTIADEDFIAMVDATDNGSGKITFENLEDAIFASVSGDILITEAGVATIQANSVALGTDTTGNYVASIIGGEGITSSGAATGEGINHSLSLDLNELTTETTIADADFIAMVDATDSGSGKITFANFKTSLNQYTDWNLYVEGVAKDDVTSGVNVNFARPTSVPSPSDADGSGLTITHSSGGTPTLETVTFTDKNVFNGLSAPTSDKIPYYNYIDGSTDTVGWVTIGSGLSFSGGTLDTQAVTVLRFTDLQADGDIPSTYRSATTASDDIYFKGGNHITTSSSQTGSVVTITFDVDASVNADTVDSLHASSFLRSDTSDTMSGNLTVTGNANFSGDVGIGTTNPSTKLHLAGNAATSGDAEIRIVEAGNNATMQIGYSDGNGFFLRLPDDANNEDVIIRSYGNTVFNGGSVGIGTASPNRLLDLETTNAGGSTLMSLVSATDGNCQLLFGDTDSDTQGKVLYNNDGDYMAFTANGSERMRINSSGNVGINETNPDTLLHINSSSVNTDYIKLSTTGVTQKSRINVSASNNKNLWIAHNYDVGSNSVDYSSHGTAAILLKADTGTDNRIAFYTGAVNTVPTERMRIDSSGNVGINTDNPASQMSAGTVLEVKDSSIASLALQGAGSSRWELTSDNVDDFKVSRNGSTAITIDGSNNKSIFAGDVQIGNELYFTSQPNVRMDDSAERNELIAVYNNTGTNNYVGFEFRGKANGANDSTRPKWNVMAESVIGFYNDTNNEWGMYCRPNAETRLFYNGSEKLLTESGGVKIEGGLNATGDVTAYYSDARLKDFHGVIENPLDKVMQLNGYYFTENSKAKELGFDNDRMQVGVSAQEIEEVLPELIKDAPIGHGYKTIDYSKITPLLIEAIKDQQKQINNLKKQIGEA